MDPQLGRTMFGDWVEQWRAVRINIRASTQARENSLLSSLILPHFEIRRLSAIRPIEVQRWVAELAETYSPHTVRGAANILSIVLNAALRNQMISSNPAAGVLLPRLERKEMRILKPSEVVEVAAAIHPRYRALVLLGGFAGLRLGEALGLRPENLNLLKRQLRVVEQLTEVGGKVTLTPVLKSDASRRTVALPGQLAQELESHLMEFSGRLLFTAPQGGPIRRSNFRRRVWRPAAGPALTFHDLRHSHAAMLIAEGVPANVIQARLGHASIRTTFDTYGHLYEGLDAAAAAAVDKMWTQDEATG